MTACEEVPLPRRITVTTRRMRRSLALALMLALLALVTACGDDATDQGNPPTPSLSAPQQDARGSAEQRALAAYRGMWQAYAKAGLTANPDEPELAKYANGEALQILTSGLADLKRKGEVLKGEYGSNPRAVDASPPTQPSAVVVEDCVDDSKFLTYKADGQLADNEPGGRRATRATVSEFGSEGWKVTTFGVQAVGTCV